MRADPRAVPGGAPTEARVTPILPAPHPAAAESARPPPHVYRAHPLLDPRLPGRQPGLARYWLGRWRELARDPSALRRTAEAFVAPLAGSQAVRQSLDRYFAEADAYVEGMLSPLSATMRERLGIERIVRESSDLGELLRLALEGRTGRLQYEARRKLYLGKLLFDIDHCRSVRDGPRHREFFEKLLDGGLWRYARSGRDEEVCCRLTPAAEGLEVGVPPSGEARCWRFNVRHLVFADGAPDIEVYHYLSRFRRNPAHPPEPEAVADESDGRVSGPRNGLPGRSGSILGKMIRRGIGDAGRVPDLLGAMFIVRERRQAFALERRLLGLFGGPFRWRDRVDTLTSDRQRDRLNGTSSGGFQVLKGIMDILLEDERETLPYLFSVEIQILPLEPYLRTIHEGHSASHAAYKRRQLLEELVPVLFPASLYGGVEFSPADRPAEQRCP